MFHIINKKIQLDIVKKIENIDSWIILLFIFSVYYLDFIPNGNEENYLHLAKAFYEPDWIENSFTLSESAGTRILYQYIVGFFLSSFSFEQVLFIFRGLFIIAFSWILYKIYKSLKINNIMIVSHLVLIYLGKQSYFAGSWIFITVEAKEFAYLFILLTLYFTIQRKYNLVVLFLVLATYFHILVGFYAFIYMALTVLIIERWNFKSKYHLIVKMCSYFIMILPFVLTLYNNIDSPIDLKPSADWIYTYFRNPHHTTLISGGLNQFSFHQLRGILLSFIAMLVLIYMHMNDKDDKMQVLYIFGIVSYAGTLLLVPLIFIDKTGSFLKFYPFRINTFSTFIFTVSLIKWLYVIVKDKYKTIIYVCIIVFSGMELVKIVLTRYFKTISYNNPSLTEVSEFIKSETDKYSVILGLNDTLNDNRVNFLTDLNLSLIRKMERDMFVVYKFVPADLNKIHEWYKRIKIRDGIAKDINNIVAVSNTYKIDYLLCKKKFDEDFLDLEFSNDTYFLYRIGNNTPVKPFK